MYSQSPFQNGLYRIAYINIYNTQKNQKHYSDLKQDLSGFQVKLIFLTDNF